MYKKFIELAKHSMVYGMADVVSKSIGFFMIPIYTRYLTPTDYGIMAILMLLTSFVGLMLPLGINSAFQRYYFEAKDEREKDITCSTALLFVSGLAALIVTILLLFNKQISTILFNSIEYAFFTKLVLITLMFQTIRIIPLQLLVVKEKSVFYTSILITQFVIGMILNIYFIVILHYGILGLLYSSLIVTILADIFLLVFTLRMIRMGFSVHRLKEMIRYGAPLAFSSILMFLYMFSDRFILQKLSSLAIVGFYALALQFGEVVEYVVYPFFIARTPFIFSNYKKEDQAKIMFSRLFTYSSLVFCFLSLGLAVYINNIFLIAVGSQFLNAYKIVPIIILAVLFRAAYNSLNIGILLMKDTKYIFYIYLIAACINIILNILLIPLIGQWGAAISRMATFLILAIMGYKISQKLYFIKYEFKRIMQMIILAMSLYFLNILIPAKPFFLSISLKSLLIAMFPSGLFLMGFFNKEEIKKIKLLLSVAKIKNKGIIYKNKPE